MKIDKVIKLKQGEAVLRIVRHYGLTFAPKAAFGFLLIAAPFFFMLPIFSLGGYGVVVFIVAVLAGLLYSLRVLMEWHWNAFVITTRRVVDIDQHGFFRRTVSEAPYDKIQDVSYAINGAFGTMLGYGAITVQTAGSQVNLELPGVKNPKEVHHLITETAALQVSKGNGGVRSQKVAHLLDAAADLSDAEARAFLVAIQEAVTSTSKPDVKVREIDGIDELMDATKEDDAGTGV